MSSIKFIKNQKNRDAILRDGYRYNLSVTNKKSSLWRCVHRDICSATITVDRTKTLVIRETSHVCIAQGIKNEIAVALAACKRGVCENLGPIQQIYEDAFEQLKLKGRNYIQHIPAFESLKNTLYRIRRRFLNVNKLYFKTLEEVKIPETIAKNFFICEDGATDKILLFSSRLSIKIMQKNSDLSYYGDGTFKSCPDPFYQLFTIHIDLKSSDESVNIFPVIFGLLPDKKEKTYIRFFNLVKDKLGIVINHYKCDYEMAQRNGVMKVFPTTKISGCYHHYNDAIWKKSDELESCLTREGRNFVRMVAILPLLPQNFIQEGWTSIVDNAPDSDEIKNFIKYFLRQWHPILSQISCAHEKHRTTNSLEGWHRRLNSRVRKTPNIFHFIKRLQKEARYYDFKIKSVLFHGLKKNRRLVDTYFDKKFKRLLTKLENGNLTTINFLRKVIYLKLVY